MGKRNPEPMTVRELIGLLHQAPDLDCPVYLFAQEGGELPGFDDRHKPLTEDCIDFDMTDQLDINVDNS